MTRPSSGSALILGLGVTVVLSLSYLFYTFFWKKPLPSLPPPETPQKIEKNEKKEVDKQENEEKEVIEVNKEEEKENMTTLHSSVMVDEGSDEEEDEEEDEDEASKIALKTSYDDALRLAKKLLAGEKFFKAAEKFTEAIKLAGELGDSAAGDVITLYNNRSAMYEKSGELELSLSDIGVVLAMDALHLKARVRRARIYEVQNKIKESCIDYMIGMLIEMSKGLQPSHQDKIEALVKAQAASESQSVVDRIRNADGRDLPTKSHCRNYFELFPSYHQWIIEYAASDRDALVQEVVANGGDFSCEEQPVSEISLDSLLTYRLEAIYSLACFDIANDSFKRAFSDVKNACSFIMANKISFDDHCDNKLRSVVADLFTIQGSSYHLCDNHEKAKECYLLALENKPLPDGIEIALRLASIHLEVDSVDSATSLFDSIQNSLPSDADTLEAWVNIHRVSEWTTRDGEGKYRSNAFEEATSVITKALDITKNFEKDSVKKACRLVALLKFIQLLSQTKVQMGMQPDNNDIANQNESVAEALKLFPQHETVQMLSVDLLAQNGQFDEAIVKCDELTSSFKDSGAILKVVKANVLCQMGMTKYAEAGQLQNQQLMMESAQYLQQGQFLYNEAIEMEPNCVEALIQLAQLKSLMGPDEMEEALSLCNRSIPHARNRDEALDIMQLKIMMENRLVAIKEMRTHGMQI